MKAPKNWKIKLGISLVILSTLFFLFFFIVPFLNYESRLKITISTVLVVLGEVTFWIGGFFLGKEIIAKYRSRLNPVNWFRKKPDQKGIES